MIEHLRHKHCNAQIGYRADARGRASEAVFIDIRSDRTITRCPDCNQYLYPLLVGGELHNESSGQAVQP